MKVYLYLFNILYLDRSDVSGILQSDRKTLLRIALVFDDPLRYTQHHNAEGEEEFRRLHLAGKVRTDFDDETLHRLATQLQRLAHGSPPFDGRQLPSAGNHWVTPSLVVEVGFEEWTAEGKLRQPRFLVLRRNKEAEDVVREQPAA